jgi:phenylalanyl-tRNA synthetase alpha chain
MAFLKNKELEEKLAKETIDISLPGKNFTPGGRNPFHVIIDEMVEIFTGMGFEVADGPEVKSIIITLNF